MQAKIDAADLAARQATYERNLLAHQLEADSKERMRLQVCVTVLHKCGDLARVRTQ